MAPSFASQRSWASSRRAMRRSRMIGSVVRGDRGGNSTDNLVDEKRPPELLMRGSSQ